MSKVLSGKALAGAETVGGFGDFGTLGRQGGNFRSLYGEEGTARAWSLKHPGQTGRAPSPAQVAPEEEHDPVEAAARDAFLQGFREGERIARETAESDNESRHALAAAIQHIAQAGEGTLAAMLSQAVVRLVGQIMGEVAIDEALLKARCAAVAACMDADASRAVLEVHPDDMHLLEEEALGVALAANPALARGSVRLGTAEGWIEDGPDVRLARLKALLDDMEGQR
jgi:flagellar assembly protein FliH